MALQYLRQIGDAIRSLNPGEVRETAEQPLSIGMYAPRWVSVLEDFLVPAGMSRAKRREVAGILHRIGGPGAPAAFDIEIYEEGVPRPPHAIAFSPARLPELVAAVLERHESDFGLALARNFPVFRAAAADKIIKNVSRENALFSLATALPDIVPSVLSLPWAGAEFASDTAFLTVNQIRMAFLLGAASDRPIGYREQKAEIASIIAAAFGWRALARQLVGKVPFGGGLIPKAAIAYAGTYTVGASIERLYRVGYGFTREERNLTYERALERGRRVAGELAEGAGRLKQIPGR